jgi:methyl-accepting chemotaxis protein
VLGEFSVQLARFGEILDRFAATVERVDGTVTKIDVISDEMGETVGELASMMETLSPAFTVNEQFRRQLERIRSLRGSG